MVTQHRAHYNASQWFTFNSQFYVMCISHILRKKRNIYAPLISSTGFPPQALIGPGSHGHSHPASSHLCKVAACPQVRVGRPGLCPPQTHSLLPILASKLSLTAGTENPSQRGSWEDGRAGGTSKPYWTTGLHWTKTPHWTTALRWTIPAQAESA